jgi:hypothetical protein
MSTTNFQWVEAKEKRIFSVVCKWCGNRYTKTNPKPGFCSQKCKEKALTAICLYCGKAFIKRTHRKNVRPICPECTPQKEKITVPVNCPTCNKLFLPRDNRQKYCSPNCWATPQVHTWYEHTCKQCGIKFKSKYKKESFCSDKCRYMPVEKVCSCCGLQFTVPKVLEKRSRYCSDECRRKVKRIQNRKAKERWEQKQVSAF